jgi:hypothetical protein
MTRCINRAVVKQQLTHVARLKAIQDHMVRETERYVCADCADVIDRDWLTVGSVTGRTPQCEGIVEEEDDSVQNC